MHCTVQRRWDVQCATSTTNPYKRRQIVVTFLDVSEWLQPTYAATQSVVCRINVVLHLPHQTLGAGAPFVNAVPINAIHLLLSFIFLMISSPCDRNSHCKPIRPIEPFHPLPVGVYENGAGATKRSSEMSSTFGKLFLWPSHQPLYETNKVVLLWLYVPFYKKKTKATVRTRKQMFLRQLFHHSCFHSSSLTE